MTSFRIRRRSVASPALLIFALALFASCGDGNTPAGPTESADQVGGTEQPTPPAGTSLSYRGVLAGDGLSGTLELSIVRGGASLRSASTSAAGAASGTLRLLGDSGTIALSGSLDDSRGQVELTGGGFTLMGQASDDDVSISGTFVAPDDSFGTFSALNTASETVTTYCGTYSGDGHGTWNLIVGGGRVSGAYSAGESGIASGTADGTVSGNNVSGSYRSNSVGDRGRFSGTLSGTSLSGTWRNDNGIDRGTFTGTSGCTP